MTENSNSTVRVYHPSGPAWQDVPKSRVGDWTKLGWKDKRPAKFGTDDDKQVRVGEGYTPPNVPADNIETEAPKPTSPKSNPSA